MAAMDEWAPEIAEKDFRDVHGPRHWSHPAGQIRAYCPDWSAGAGSLSATAGG